ncbi:hypothetical protein ABID22_002199 [Pontibacter aydingkolensis]
MEITKGRGSLEKLPFRVALPLKHIVQINVTVTFIQ